MATLERVLSEYLGQKKPEEEEQSLYGRTDPAQNLPLASKKKWLI